MTRRLIRLALHAYPARWRRRYGSELEQLSIDVLTSRPGTARRVRLIVVLVMCGVGKRAHSLRRARRAVLAVATATIAASAVAFTIESSTRSLATVEHAYVLNLVDHGRASGWKVVRVAGKRMSMTTLTGPSTRSGIEPHRLPVDIVGSS